MSIIAAFPSNPTTDPDPYVPPVPTYDNEFDYEVGVEHKIGKWIDGKDLYQTVYKVTMSSLSTSLGTINKLAHNIANIDKPLIMKRITTNVASKIMAKWPQPMDVSSTSYTSQYHLYLERFTKTELWVRRGTNTTEQEYGYIALQYTKEES